jgi:SAM-dependent methyltransferase
MADHPSESVIDLYRRHAVQWDVARRSRGWNDRIWIDAFAMRLARGSRVLDLGCAGGEPVARFLVEQGMQVTGVDSHAGAGLDRRRHTLSGARPELRRYSRLGQLLPP